MTKRLNSEEFVALANASGLPLTIEAIDALKKRGLLDSWANDEYGVPHLFLVSFYFESIQIYRHPWAVTQSDVKLDRVKTANKTVVALGPNYAIENDKVLERVGSLAREVEGYINRIDPFGPIAAVVDILRNDVVDQLQGVGRRYATLRGFAHALADAIERVEVAEAHLGQSTLVEPKLSEPQDVDDKARPLSPAEQTREMPAHVDPPPAPPKDPPPAPPKDVPIDVPIPEVESISSEPTDDVTIDDPPIQDSKNEPIEVESPKLEEPEDTVIKPPSTESLAADSEPSEGFDRSGPQYRTARTQDLLSRLKNLKTEEGEVENEPEDLEAQIAELNKQREALMKSHNWAGLVTLYETKIDLFPVGPERQQVFLTLAQIQELKLKNRERALEFFAAAIETEADAGREKAYAGLVRVGTKDGLAASLVEWLEGKMADDCSSAERALIQHAYSCGLKELGEKQRAFLSYAAFLAEEPETLIDAHSLEGLETFASEVEDSELETFYQDVLEQEAPQNVRVLVATRAGLLYMSRNPMLAVKYFRQAVDEDPRTDVAYNNLVHLYQEEHNWADLVELASARWVALPPPERQALFAQIGHFVDQDIDESDDAFERYKAAAEEDPDSLSMEWSIRAFVKTGRFTEAYAFLNRMLEHIEAMPRRVTVLKTLAELAIDQLAAPEEAVIHYQSGLELVGPRRDLLEGLASLRIQAGSWNEAVSLLDTLTGGEVVLPDDARLHWLVKGVQVAEQASKGDAVSLFKTRIATIDGNHELLR